VSGDRRIDGTMPVGFRYTPGPGAGAFLDGLRAGALTGSRCEGCGVTYLPSRLFCERCMAELTPDVSCGPEGTLASWTTLAIDVDGAPLAEPVVYALVRFDGADTVLLHRLLVGSDAEPAIGDRVRAVFRAERGGSILDLEGFAPL
jgi:hypothetical protein